MNVELVNFYNEKFKVLYDTVKESFVEFCENNNYTYNSIYLQENDPRITRLNKFSIISNTLETTKADYVIYSDLDILIKDTTFNIFENYNFNKDITFSKDKQGLCSGFIIIKVTDFSKQFFKTCMYLGSHTQKECDVTNQLQNWNGKYDASDDSDQELIKSLYYSYTNIRDNVDVDFPEWIVSNPLSTDAGSFAHHYWSRCFGLDQTIDLISNNITWTS